MTTDTLNSCSPSHPTAIMQIHGMQDTVVPYFGTLGSKSIDDVMEYWAAYNGCSLIHKEKLSIIPKIVMQLQQMYMKTV